MYFLSWVLMGLGFTILTLFCSNKRRFEALRKQSLKSLELGCYEDALLVFERILKLKRFYIYFDDIYFLQGILLHALERYKEALSSYDLALKYRFFNPRRFSSYIWLRLKPIQIYIL